MDFFPGSGETLVKSDDFDHLEHKKTAFGRSGRHPGMLIQSIAVKNGSFFIAWICSASSLLSQQ
jgi:hypothetical protein